MHWQYFLMFQSECVSAGYIKTKESLDLEETGDLVVLLEPHRTCDTASVRVSQLLTDRIIWCPLQRHHLYLYQKVPKINVSG